MDDEPPLMFKVWVRNETTKETAVFLGQGNNAVDAVKDGWNNACEAFGKDSSGGFTSEARLGVKLPNGETVFRRPQDFASGRPYDPKTEFKPAPVCEGDAALPHAELVKQGKARWNPNSPKK